MPRSNKKKSSSISQTKHPPSKSSSCLTPTQSSSTVMVLRAISSARKHGIDLKQGTPIASDGNCAFQSAICNLNDRKCFNENLPQSSDYYRRIWMTDMKNRTVNDQTWNIYSKVEWEKGWAEIMESGVYERGIFGDLMLFGIACGIKKTILIFNTSFDSPHDPIYICDPRKFGVLPDTEIPLVMAYNLFHYESMHPVQQRDCEETIKLVTSYLDGSYKFGKKDLPFLINVEDDITNQTSMETEEKETRGENLNSFQNSLPDHLRGKRPRDMDKDDKKEYNNYRTKFSRANATDTQTKTRKEKDRMAKVEKKKNATEEEKQEKRKYERNFNAKKRANEEPAQSQKRKEKDNLAKKMQNAKHSQYLGRNAQKVLSGEQIVPELKSSKDSIGRMDTICQYCNAKKWKNETPSLCCNGGKVSLPLFPSPPKLIENLLTGKTVEAKLFRENTRSFNNGLALSSIKVNLRHFNNGYNPSVIFEGKVSQLYGPLIPENGEEPRFSQLYIHDPATEHTMRVKNMCLPTNLSKDQVRIITQTVQKLQNLLRKVNPFVKDFLHICEIPDDQLKDGKIVLSCRKKDRPNDAHERRYNTQTSFSEVSILTNFLPSDLVLRKRGGGLQHIYDLHPDANPLHFVLLFPYGTPGYSEFMKHNDKVKRVSPREYFAFHLNMRDLDADFLFRFGRLFQEYICLAFTTIENQKLKFQKNNQSALRADTYKNVKDVASMRVPIGDKISKDDHQIKIGKRIILSKSFIGSPRWYHSKFQDGMAICRKYHKPDFFITFTCNANWEEIKRELREGETAQNRPDIVARVFKLKKDQLMKDITSGNIFGKVPAFLWVIEFQKRGLPHAHILVILAEADRINSSEDIDNAISAQLPPDPSLLPIGSEERAQAERLERIVLQNMVHGPCGKMNPSSPCMVDGKCGKGYPKKFCDKTIIHPDNTYPEYQRLEPSKGGRSIIINNSKGCFEIDNRWIVPYSPFLCLRFDCHTNNELCMSPLASKYLFKYVTKGEDRAMVRAEIDDEDQEKSEIADYIDMRSVGSSEASWHIFNFNIAKNYPAVYALRVHLEDEQHVVFDMETAEQSVESQRCTELTEFFTFNLEHPETKVTYCDFPEHFTWKNKEWKERKRSSDSIGRIHVVNPVAGDVYYLRILLHHDHCKGKNSFNDLRTLDGVLLETYQEVCRGLGLLQDDEEWDQALTEGAVTKMPSALRELFITILMFCMPSNPQELFDKHHMEWSDDFELEAQKRSVVLTESQIRTKILIDIRQRLNAWDRDLKNFRIMEPTEDELKDIAFLEPTTYSVLIREELDFDVKDLTRIIEERRTALKESQRKVFDVVLNAVDQEGTVYVFIDARGGTGKTFLLNTILAAVRVKYGGSIALAVGATGIAANLLHLGRTLHSRFKVPLNIDKDSICNIPVQSNLAELIRMTKIIVWDEAPMGHRYQLEALDRTLRDITDIDKPFGGKILVLAGDFRQCLPVIPNASRAEVVEAALNRSPLWSVFQVMQLQENMRVQMSNDPDAENFDAFTLKLGNGEVQTIDESDYVELPEELCMEIEKSSSKSPNAEKDSMQKLADHVYPDLNSKYKESGWMNGRAILAPTNKQVDQINDLITDSFPGKPAVLTSSDDLINANDFQRYNIEYLNTLSPTGLPNHRLFIKPGMPLMLMRNLNPKMGLCNGTRLIFNKVHNIHLLECSIVGGEHNTRKVLIPRVTLKPKDRKYPFEWCRRQFPVRVAFAMTINKSQGQTLSNVGVWLNDPCFAHGQLYVCISRVGSPSHIKFAIRKKDGYKWNSSSNVVYKEVLIKGIYAILHI